MKVLIALALFAVAFADEVQVVSLPRAAIPEYQVPDMGQLIVPQEMIDSLKFGEPVLRGNVLVVDGPAPVENVEDLTVRVAESAFDTPQDFNVPEPVMVAEPNFEEFKPIIPEPVRLGEPTLPEVEEFNAPEPVLIAEPTFEKKNPIVPEPVKLAEPVLPVVEKFIAEPVMMIAEPIFDFAPESVLFEAIDVIVPEPVMLPAAPEPAFETEEAAAVDTVNVANPEESQYAYQSAPVVEAVKVVDPIMPGTLGKVFDNPMLR